MILGSVPSNSSLLDFYDYVMTFNDSIVELTCCKSDGTPTRASCGQGLSCANACYAQEASLCPSQNCDDCGNLDQESDESETRKGGSRKRPGGGQSVVTHLASAFKYCLRRDQFCPIKRSPECCFHPKCAKKRKEKCQWLQAFVGKSTY